MIRQRRKIPVGDRQLIGNARISRKHAGSVNDNGTEVIDVGKNGPWRYEVSEACE